MSDVIEIDLMRAASLLGQVVKGNEDFVYEIPNDGDNCVYVSQGEPSCMVGKALALAGVTPEELAEMDDDAVGSTINRVPMPERVNLTIDARRFFAVAQQEQDFHQPWGVSYNLAMSRYVTTPDIEE